MARGERRKKREEVGDGLEERTIFIRRVAKVVKGGRRFNFSAMLVVGDRQGKVGVGMGKATDVQQALQKAGKQARKNMLTVPRLGTSIPHDIIGKFGAAKVMLRPAAPGTGIIAGTTVRSVVELAGIRDILTKCYGSRNPLNTVRATLQALLALKEPGKVAAQRGIAARELMGFAVPLDAAAQAAAAALAAQATAEEDESNETA